MAKTPPLVTTILTALENAVTLDIATSVGPVQWDARTPKQMEGVAGHKAIYSAISLAQGDILTQMDAAYIEDEKMKALWVFHKQREAQGQKIVNDNIATLKALVQFAIDLSKHDADDNAG